MAITGSGNNLLPDSTKPLPKPVLTYCESKPDWYNSMKLYSKFNMFNRWNLSEIVVCIGHFTRSLNMLKFKHFNAFLSCQQSLFLYILCIKPICTPLDTFTFHWHLASPTPINTSGIILCMRSANERWRYTVTPSLIGWAHTQNDLCTKTKPKWPPFRRQYFQMYFFVMKINVLWLECHWNLLPRAICITQFWVI